MNIVTAVRYFDDMELQAWCVSASEIRQYYGGQTIFQHDQRNYVFGPCTTFGNWECYECCTLKATPDHVKHKCNTIVDFVNVAFCPSFLPGLLSFSDQCTRANQETGVSSKMPEWNCESIRLYFSFRPMVVMTKV